MLWRLLIKMAWVKQILRGAEFTFESIQMMIFIIEEACQTSNMAYGTALNNLKLDLAKKILDDVLIPSRSAYWNNWVIYVMPFMPNRYAWLCFYEAFNLQVQDASRSYENYRKIIDMGLDPRKKTKYKYWQLFSI